MTVKKADWDWRQAEFVDRALFAVVDGYNLGGHLVRKALGHATGRSPIYGWRPTSYSFTSRMDSIQFEIVSIYWDLQFGINHQT